MKARDEKADWFGNSEKRRSMVPLSRISWRIRTGGTFRGWWYGGSWLDLDDEVRVLAHNFVAEQAPVTRYRRRVWASVARKIKLYVDGVFDRYAHTAGLLFDVISEAERAIADGVDRSANAILRPSCQAAEKERFVACRFVPEPCLIFVYPIPSLHVSGRTTSEHAPFTS